ncbi:hypothetical protein M758_1G281500 [Ceratodon purpureus]|nr:hypothetical protein M758_1G281500 [Ceratodon purpureus]
MPQLLSPSANMDKVSPLSAESSSLKRGKLEQATEGISDDAMAQVNSDASKVAEVTSTSSKGTEMGSEVRVSESDTLDFEGIIWIQGIEPSLELPLEWVVRNLVGQRISFTSL